MVRVSAKGAARGPSAWAILDVLREGDAALPAAPHAVTGSRYLREVLAWAFDRGGAPRRSCSPPPRRVAECSCVTEAAPRGPARVVPEPPWGICLASSGAACAAAASPSLPPPAPRVGVPGGSVSWFPGEGRGAGRGVTGGARGRRGPAHPFGYLLSLLPREQERGAAAPPGRTTPGTRPSPRPGTRSPGSAGLSPRPGRARPAAAFPAPARGLAGGSRL